MMAVRDTCNRMLSSPTDIDYRELIYHIDMLMYCMQLPADLSVHLSLPQTPPNSPQNPTSPPRDYDTKSI